jgi:hypothetical protein
LRQQVAASAGTSDPATPVALTMGPLSAAPRTGSFGPVFVKFCEIRSGAGKSENESSRKCLTCGYLSARATGLEPATTGSTVRYSNQLSYAPEGSRLLAALCGLVLELGRAAWSWLVSLRHTDSRRGPRSKPILPRRRLPTSRLHPEPLYFSRKELTPARRCRSGLVSDQPAGAEGQPD